VPINSVPVDQSAFTRLMLVEVAPKTDRDTGQQVTTKDGLQRKWTVQCVASMPSRWEAGRNDSDVLQVTVTCADDPTMLVAEGDLLVFEGLTAGVMSPEAGDNGRIRGGKLFWSASGVRSRVPAGGKS
jgi:hypothetical protein